MDIRVGIDLGGTTSKVGIFEGERLVETFEVPTDKSNGGAAILPNLVAAIKEKTAGSHLLGVGIGVPGPVKEDGSVERCVNLGWGRMNPAEYLTEQLGVPAKVGNDANVAALGEAFYGGGRQANGEPCKNMVMITLGTGVGGGLVVDGKLITGVHGLGGEVGHMVVNMEEKEHCNCGNCGCLEQYASATGIVRLAKRTIKAEPDRPTVLKGDFSCKDVLDAAKAGDAVAEESCDKSFRYLALGMSHIALSVDPAMFILGGGVSKAGDYLIRAVEKYYGEFTHISAGKPEIRLATLGNDAGMYGAMAMLL